MLRGLGSLGATGAHCSAPPRPPWCWESIYFSPVHTCPLIECVSGLYLYLGRCESNCPPGTYPGVNSKEREACMPCHYTCLTCAGESDGECTSCHDDAVRTPSGLKDAREAKILEAEVSKEGRKHETVAEDLPTVEDDVGHLSWGKRSASSKKAVTKKILEPHDAPRTLFFCYPARVTNEIRASDWYRRMSVLFAANLLLLLGILLCLAWNRFRSRKTNGEVLDGPRYRYSKMSSNGGSSGVGNAENILYVSSSTEEE